VAHRIVLVCVGLVFGGTLAAQQRAIAGKVTGSLDGKAIAGASVAVVGTARLAATNGSGEYTVLAPAGPVTLSVRAVGYKRKVLNVSGEQTTADVVLEADIFNLDAIVVTGQATGVEQRNLANAVTTVRAEDLNRAPTGTLEGALQGKIPGALIQENSGAPGGGVQINLRGVSTINASVDPLIVVDGIIISNDAIGNNLNAITAAAAGGNASNQDNPVNRIADLNPADIDKIEVLKGASAASIYGAQAANGVIIISTRRGQAGAPQFRMTQRLGESHVIHVLKSRVFRDSVEADSVYGTKAQTYCRPTCPYFDNISPLWDRHPLSSETDLSVSGGSDQTRYFVSGLVKRDGGIAPGTGYDKQAARVNLDQQLGSRWTLNFQTQAIHSLSHRGISNNDNSGTSPYLVFPLTPSFVDLRPTGSRISDYPVNPFERSNPLQTYAFLRNDEDVWRILATATLGWQPVATDRQTLRFTFTGGLDNFTQRNDIFSPPELQFEPNDGQPGTVVLGKTQNTNVNALGNAVYTLTPASRAYRATTSLGVQYFDKSLNFTNLVGRNLPPGQINLRARGSAGSGRAPVADGGRARGADQPQREREAVLPLPQGCGLLPLPGPRGIRGRRAEAARRLGPDGQPAQLRQQVHAQRHRDHRRPVRQLRRFHGRGGEHQTGAADRARGRSGCHARQRPLEREPHGVHADGVRPDSRSDTCAVQRTGRECVQRGPPPRPGDRSGRGVRRNANPNGELARPRDVHEDHEQSARAAGPGVPGGWIRDVPGRVPGRGRQVGDADRRQRFAGQRGAGR